MNLFRKPRLKAVNDGLTLVVALMAIYLLLSPFQPAITFWGKQHTGTVKALSNTISQKQAKHAPYPADDRLVVPAMALDEQIYEGDSASILNKGLWRRPRTSTPDNGGNTVIVGHRFTYHNSAVFYDLDKVKVGDTIAVYWNQKRYSYTVDSIFIVTPDQVTIEANSGKPMLTLYTCTPLWTSKLRLVVQANLTGVTQ